MMVACSRAPSLCHGGDSPVSNLLAYDTILLGHTTNLLFEVRGLLGIATKMALLGSNDALGVMLQLE
jgi:hypothetical protein